MWVQSSIWNKEVGQLENLLWDWHGQADKLDKSTNHFEANCLWAVLAATKCDDAASVNVCGVWCSWVAGVTAVVEGSGQCEGRWQLLGKKLFFILCVRTEHWRTDMQRLVSGWFLTNHKCLLAPASHVWEFPAFLCYVHMFPSTGYCAHFWFAVLTLGWGGKNDVLIKTRCNKVQW